MAWFEWTIPDAETPVGFVANQTMFHATREEHVEAILKQGLLTGAPAYGALSAPAGEDHHDEFYGIRPVYLLLEPAISSTYEWAVEDDKEEDVEPVLLEVDARGLTVVPDLATLEIPTTSGCAPRASAGGGAVASGSLRSTRLAFRRRSLPSPPHAASCRTRC
jgi:hypothetical protein